MRRAACIALTCAVLAAPGDASRDAIAADASTWRTFELLSDAAVPCARLRAPDLPAAIDLWRVLLGHPGTPRARIVIDPESVEAACAASTARLPE